MFGPFRDAVLNVLSNCNEFILLIKSVVFLMYCEILCSVSPSSAVDWSVCDSGLSWSYSLDLKLK